MNSKQHEPISILLVEDDPGDVILTKRALAHGAVYKSLNVVGDGIEALAFLRKEDEFALAPDVDLILLDLNMPRMDGREALTEIKADSKLNQIPVIILTTSDAEQDIAMSTALGANYFITKPTDLNEFARVAEVIQELWSNIATG